MSRLLQSTHNKYYKRAKEWGLDQGLIKTKCSLPFRELFRETVYLMSIVGNVTDPAERLFTIIAFRIWGNKQELWESFLIMYKHGKKSLGAKDFDYDRFESNPTQHKKQQVEEDEPDETPKPPLDLTQRIFFILGLQCLGLGLLSTKHGEVQ